jgi:hypothetical protein
LSLLALTGYSAAGSLAPAAVAEAATSPSPAPVDLTINPRPSPAPRPSSIARPGSRPRPTAAAAATPSPAVPDVPVVEASPGRPVADRGGEPTRLRLAAVDIDVAVRPTGVADDGTMAIPGTVRRAGWYRYGARPSDPSGSTVIAAHVDTRREGLGPFARLSSVGKGDAVVVTARDGRKVRYRVTTQTRVRRTKLPIDDLFDRDGSPRLVLLTCGGAYDADNGYTDNVVVIALPDR